MRQLGACKLGEPLEGGLAALRVIAIYCSDDIPGRLARTQGLADAMQKDASRLLDIVSSIQKDAQIPEASGGERVRLGVGPTNCKS